MRTAATRTLFDGDFVVSLSPVHGSLATALTVNTADCCCCGQFRRRLHFHRPPLLVFSAKTRPNHLSLRKANHSIWLTKKVVIRRATLQMYKACIASLSCSTFLVQTDKKIYPDFFFNSKKLLILCEFLSLLIMIFVHANNSTLIWVKIRTGRVSRSLPKMIFQ